MSRCQKRAEKHAFSTAPRNLTTRRRSLSPDGLVEAGDPGAIDVYLCEQDAHRALEDCLRDEPDWRGLVRVEEIELQTSRACR
jgi:hypothetical protein